jgi:hypothetical protein
MSPRAMNKDPLFCSSWHRLFCLPGYATFLHFFSRALPLQFEASRPAFAVSFAEATTSKPEVRNEKGKSPRAIFLGCSPDVLLQRLDLGSNP